MVAHVFIICVCIVIAGWLWFYIVRPILEDFGIIRDEESVNYSQVVMSPMPRPPAPAELVRTGGSAAPNHPQIADTYQAEPPEPAPLEPVREPVAISHKMSRKALTVLLAVQKDDDGDYRYSANKITEFVGGTRQEALDLIAEARGTKVPEPKPVSPGVLRRPAGGW